MSNKFPSEKETVSGLKSKDNQAYEILYSFYYPSVKNFVLKNNGSEDDAKDVFQETILVLLHKVPKENFNLSSSLKTYVFAISSNIWLKRLRESKKLVKDDVFIYEKYLIDYEEAESELHKQNIKKSLNVFEKITFKCKVLLQAIFFDKKDIEAVTREFGYTNKHNAQNQKYKCLEQARKGGRYLD